MRAIPAALQLAAWLWVSGLWPAALATAAQLPQRDSARRGDAWIRRDAPPAPDWPSGCEPALVRDRLVNPDSADVARACGNIRLPWAYRGPLGRGLAMRSYGRRDVDGAWAARAMALLLDSAAVDTIYRVPGTEVSCDPARVTPVYLLRIHRAGHTTSVVLRFELGAAMLFDAEEPLGMIDLGTHADSLWALLSQPLFDDPVLRRPRPALTDSLMAASHVVGELVVVDAPPRMVGSGEALPPYPEDALKQGIEGTVHVLARVGEDGAVHDAVVHAGPMALRDVALEAVWGMRFKPALRHGRPVTMWTMVPLTFRVH